MQPMDHTTLPQKKLAPKYPFTLQVLPADLRKNPICPSAATSIYACCEPGRFHLFATCCKRWGCAYCARRRIQQLACQTAAAAPNRLLTLTLDPKFFENPKDCWQKTAPKVSELIRKLRVRFGDVEYLRVTELHKSGWPHYHLLVRSKYLPFEVVRNLWSELTGGTRVNLEAVTKTFSAYWYLTKYLAKMHNKGWTDRHVSTSRNFFPKTAKTKPTVPGLVFESIDPVHPYRFLVDHHYGQALLALGPCHWLVWSYPGLYPEQVANWELGLPLENHREAPKQTTMIGEDD